MASEALEEKKPEEEAPVEDKHEVAEAGEDQEKEIDPPEVSEKAAENEGEVAEETPKKGKRGRKSSSSKSETESKKRGGDSAAKKEKEPVTPVSERPTRERKVVERYSAPETGRSASTKPLSIEKVLYCAENLAVVFSLQFACVIYTVVGFVFSRVQERSSRIFQTVCFTEAYTIVRYFYMLIWCGTGSDWYSMLLAVSRIYMFRATYVFLC